MTMTAAGVAKLIEECGELSQILGKKLAYWHTDDHPDGKGSISARIEDEMADVRAAISFVIVQLDLDDQRIVDRQRAKQQLFTTWQDQIDNNDQAIDRRFISDYLPRAGIVDVTIQWTCEICSQPIEDGKGYIELPHSERLRYKAEEAEWKAAYPDTQDEVRFFSLDRMFAAPEDCHWWSVHRDCDPNPDGGGYWFDVGRVRTHRDLLNWTLHLMAKSWIDETDWECLVRRAMSPSDAEQRSPG